MQELNDTYFSLRSNVLICYCIKYVLVHKFPICNEDLTSNLGSTEGFLFFVFFHW